MSNKRKSPLRSVGLAVALGVLVAGSSACGGGGEKSASPAEVAQGQKLYQQTCAMCHGFEGEGVARLGKPIVGSAFVRQLSDDDLIRFLIEGRAADHPDNTQGIPMPPRGGNPGLSDADLALIVAYLRSIS